MYRTQRRLLSRLAACGVVALALSGCSDGEGSAAGPAGKAKLKVGIVFDTGGLGDKSFNDSAWRGVQRAERELGVSVTKVESTKESDYPTNLRALADQGAGVVVAVGINMRVAVQRVAPDYPDVRFVSVDGEPLDLPNVRTIQFREEEGSFLVGYLAGLMTKTNRIGFVGGMELPLIKRFQYGYAAGAMAANPAVRVLPPKYTMGWDNQDTAKVSANLLFGEGADIVFHAAGRAGLGVIAAARERGKFAIGVDSDQDGLAPGTVLTSMVKRVDEGVFQTIRDVKEGRWSAGALVYDLKAGGVGTSEFAHTRDLIGEERLAKLNAMRERLVAGEVTVPFDEASFKAFKP